MPENAPHIIELPQIRDHRGNLSVISSPEQAPFAIAGTCWAYGATAGLSISTQAYYSTHELITTLKGSVTVTTLIGGEERVFQLESADRALYIPPMTWREVIPDSPDTVVLFSLSALMDSADVISTLREYEIIAATEYEA
ncbi:MAG: FdtA/QdtA family cupin domain-containing protein [Muribaculaceae bacterium]|nr:FdtA/QdtA family cupin domain-containing protein [Muribaculaceae bacterium]